MASSRIPQPLNAAIAAFGGAAGVGHGGEQRPLTTKEKIALASEKVKQAIDGKAIKKVIVVPKRIVNIAVA